MKNKIIKIKGCKTCKEVLLFLDRNDDCEEFVQLIAWHNSKEGYFIQKAIIKVSDSDNDSLLYEQIIYDYSEFSANQFANSFKE